MGKIDTFALTFLGNKTVYYPGEVLNGAVVLKLNKELKLREIKIEFHGEARVRWSQSSGSGNNRRTHTYHNNEIYINNCATLFGKGMENQSYINNILVKLLIEGFSLF